MNIKEKKEDILELINKVHWYHSYEIVPGIISPGSLRVDAKRIFDFRFKLDQNLEGKRILEIGTWDGPYAFELESRGATVVATDIQDPDLTGFNTAKKIRKSNVKYVQTSVYDIDTKVDGLFDMVIFFGVFYHLKHPLLAFEKIQKKLKDGGTMLFEGECLTHYGETLPDHKTGNRLLLLLLGISKMPISLNYPGLYKGNENWVIPNLACFEGWLIASGFRIEELRSTLYLLIKPLDKLSLFKRVMRTIKHIYQKRDQRVWGKAVKLNKEPIKEHRLVKTK